MAANDRPADIQWLVDNQTDEITGYISRGREMRPPVFLGQIADGSWTPVPSIFRLRLTGTGTCTIDAKDSLGNITLAVASYTASGATDQIEFPYAGNNAVAIRATFSGDVTVEVI